MKSTLGQLHCQALQSAKMFPWDLENLSRIDTPSTKMSLIFSIHWQQQQATPSSRASRGLIIPGLAVYYKAMHGMRFPIFLPASQALKEVVVGAYLSLCSFHLTTNY